MRDVARGKGKSYSRLSLGLLAWTDRVHEDGCGVGWRHVRMDTLSACY